MEKRIVTMRTILKCILGALSRRCELLEEGMWRGREEKCIESITLGDRLDRLWEDNVLVLSERGELISAAERLWSILLMLWHDWVHDLRSPLCQYNSTQSTSLRSSLTLTTSLVSSSLTGGHMSYRILSSLRKRSQSTAI